MLSTAASVIDDRLSRPRVRTAWRGQELAAAVEEWQTAAAALVAAYPVEDLCTQQQQQPCCSSSRVAAAVLQQQQQQQTREPKHAVHQVAMQLVVLTAEVVHLCVHQHSTMSRMRLMQCTSRGGHA